MLHPRVWRPGVDLADHHPRLRDEDLHDRWARVHSPDGGRLVVGYVGPLERTKVLTRLAGVARLPGVRLVALGEGPGTEGLRAAGAKVITNATSAERARCVASLDVMLQPRKREVYAPSVHEALASGVPVVAYDSGTATDVVRHEQNGLLVDTGRGGKTFARAVARLAASPDLRYTLAAAARESVDGRSWDDAVAELVDVHYPAVVRRPSAAPARPLPDQVHVLVPLRLRFLNPVRRSSTCTAGVASPSWRAQSCSCSSGRLPPADATTAGVTRAQKRLNALHCDAGPADGRAGTWTRSAVLRFQSRHGLPQSGQLTASTRARLYAANARRCDDARCPPTPGRAAGS